MTLQYPINLAENDLSAAKIKATNISTPQLPGSDLHTPCCMTLCAIWSSQQNIP